uniref:Uncharacterized protein n=1 Tax=Rhizophora mucronata TaxID=61149 RepID=A0A2P2NA40_RHIMU
MQIETGKSQLIKFGILRNRSLPQG